MTLKLEIVPDEDCESPRSFDCNVGRMALFNSRHTVPNETDPRIKSGDFNGWEEMQQHLVKKHKACAILPVYMYDHSGTALRTTPFNDSWDSGQLGFIYTTREIVADMLGKKKLTPAALRQVVDCLKSEVKEFGLWMNGETYGYEIYDNDEFVEGCYGFIGEEHAQQEGNEALEFLLKKESENEQ